MSIGPCDDCLARLCVTKNEGGFVTGLFFSNGDGSVTEIESCPEPLPTIDCEALRGASSVNVASFDDANPCAQTNGNSEGMSYDSELNGGSWYVDVGGIYLPEENSEENLCLASNTFTAGITLSCNEETGYPEMDVVYTFNCDEDTAPDTMTATVQSITLVNMTVTPNYQATFEVVIELSQTGELSECLAEDDPMMLVFTYVFTWN